MAYLFQDFEVGQVLTAAAMDQVEENIRDHVHGEDGVANWYVGVEATGSSNAYVITVTPTPAEYVTGMVVMFKANHENTGAATLNVNGLGAKAIQKFADTALAAANIKANSWHVAVYDGTAFQLLSQLSSGVTVADLSKAQGSASVGADTTFAVHQFAFASPTWSGSTGDGVSHIAVNGRNWRGQSQGSSTVTWDYLQ